MHSGWPRPTASPPRQRRRCCRQTHAPQSSTRLLRARVVRWLCTLATRIPSPMLQASTSASVYSSGSVSSAARAGASALGRQLPIAAGHRCAPPPAFRCPLVHPILTSVWRLPRCPLVTAPVPVYLRSSRLPQPDCHGPCVGPTHRATVCVQPPSASCASPPHLLGQMLCACAHVRRGAAITDFCATRQNFWDGRVHMKVMILEYGRACNSQRHTLARCSPQGHPTAHGMGPVARSH